MLRNVSQRDAFDELKSAGETSHVKWTLDSNFRDDIEVGNLYVNGQEHEGKGVAKFHSGQERMTVDFAVSAGTAALRRIEIEGDDLTVQLLQSISVSETKRAILDQLDRDLPIRQAEQVVTLSFQELREQWPNGDNLDAFLYVVRHIYNSAVARQMPATMQVAKTFEVSRATAARMVAKAREEGYELASPAPFPGKRKGKSDATETPSSRRTRGNQDQPDS